MFKYWLKNRLLISTIYLLVITIVVSFSFVSNSIKSNAEAHKHQSLYIGSKIDFDIPSPGKDQIAELDSLVHIEKTIPYYFTNKTVALKNNKKINNVGILMFDNFNDIELTMYNSNKVIEKSTTLSNNPLFVDREFILKTGLKLEDKVNIDFGNKMVEFVIDAIYEDNTYYTTLTIVGLWKGAQKSNTENLTGKELKYSGAYVISNNHGQSKSYFENDYKPLGKLKDRSEFSDEESYQIHYNAFMSSNYSNEITDFEVRKIKDLKDSTDAKNKSLILINISGLLIIGAMIFINILFLKRKKTISYFKITKRKGKKYNSFNNINMMFELVLSLLAITMLFLIISKNPSLYIPQNKLLILYSIITGYTLLGIILSYIINKKIMRRIW